MSRDSPDLGAAPEPPVSDEQMAPIVRHVRELRQANGIRFAPHRM